MAEKTIAGGGGRSLKRDTPGRADAWGALVAAGATMLLVARPLVLGEDPGLLVDRLSDPSGLSLTLLWLILGTIWAARQASNGAASRSTPLSHRIGGRGQGEGGDSRSGVGTSLALDRLDVAMLGLVAVIAISAGQAAYLHPARLIAWEWLVFWIVLVVIRRLARDERIRRCLLAAMLATAASISAYACYQSAVELPALRRQVQDRSTTVMEELGREGISLDSDDPTLEAWRQRVMAGHVFGTFAHPNTFAGYLALLIPPACACAVFGFRRRSRMRWVMAIMSLLLVTALILTHSRGAIGGVSLVALFLACLGWNKLRARTSLAWLIPAGLAAALVVGWLLAPSRALDLARKSLGLRLDYWSATVRMMTDPQHTNRLLFGVGPGMFGRYYPRYMNWQATEKITDPHNFILELWATSGTAAAVLIISVFGIALGWSLPRAAATQDGPTMAHGGREAAIPRLFVYGGLAGMSLAFGLTAMNQEPDALVGSAWMATARMLVWLIAFYAFASGVYPGRLLSMGMGAGISACLVNSLVSGGISFPALAQCLWAAIALACPAGVVAKRKSEAGYMLIVPAAVGVLLVAYYVSTVYWPVMQASRYSSRARNGMAIWSAGKGQSRTADGLFTHVISPLESAVQSDPEDASAWVSLADEYGTLWRLHRSPEVLDKTIHAADKATKIDPEGKEGYLAEYRIGQSAAAHDQGAMLERSVSAMRSVIERDPSEAKWHYLLAESLRKSGQKVEAAQEAKKARELDQLAGSGPRRLNNRQREQLEGWLRER